MRNSGSNLQFASYVADGVQQNLINWIEDKLVLAGWTVSSGSHSATIVLRSATTPAPASHAISVRLKTASNAATVELLNGAGTVVSQLYYIVPTAGLEWRIIAGKYQAFIFAINPTTVRTQVMFGVPYVPDFLVSSGYTLSGDYGWITGDSDAPTGTTAFSTWRSTLGTTQYFRYTIIRNGAAWNQSIGNGGNRTNGLNIAVQVMWRAGSIWLPTWANGALSFSEPTFGCQEAAAADFVYSRFLGVLWDAMIENGVSLTIDTTIPFDSKTWYVFTTSTAVNPLAQLVLRTA